MGTNMNIKMKIIPKAINALKFPFVLIVMAPLNNKPINNLTTIFVDGTWQKQSTSEWSSCLSQSHNEKSTNGHREWNNG